MSEAMMPISADALHHRAMLFDLSKPVTMSPETFDEIWPYVDSVYSKLQSELLQANGTVQYECRLRKAESRAQLEMPVITRSLNGGVAVFESSTFATSE